MKLRSAGLFAIGLVAITATSALAASFNRTGSMNAARLYHTATLLANGEVLVTGGDNSTDFVLASAELYNPATGRWTLTGSMTVPRHAHDLVSVSFGCRVRRSRPAPTNWKGCARQEQGRGMKDDEG